MFGRTIFRQTEILILTPASYLQRFHLCQERCTQHNYNVQRKVLEKRLIHLTENCCILISSLFLVIGTHMDTINPQLFTAFKSQVEIA